MGVGCIYSRVLPAALHFPLLPIPFSCFFLRGGVWRVGGLCLAGLGSVALGLGLFFASLCFLTNVPLPHRSTQTYLKQMLTLIPALQMIDSFMNT